MGCRTVPVIRWPKTRDGSVDRNVRRIVRFDGVRKEVAVRSRNLSQVATVVV